MRILTISDTHGLEDSLTELIKAVQADVLVHTGDVTRDGQTYEFTKFLEWFSRFKHIQFKLFCAGNHDYCLAQKPYSTRLKLAELEQPDAEGWGIEPGVYYLENSGVIIQGVPFWGSPLTPEWGNYSFTYPRTGETAQIWNRIPRTTQVLLTHGPPMGKLDWVHTGKHVGCKALATQLAQLPDLKLHVFGHIHQDDPSLNRAVIENGITYINASQVDNKLRLISKPILHILQ